MADVIKSIKASGGDYSSIVSWESDLDSAVIYSSGDNAIGELYDEEYDEVVVLDGGGTIGLTSATLRGKTGERHDGTAGTGARIVSSNSSYTGINFSVVTNASSSPEYTIEWIEFSQDTYDNGYRTLFHSSSAVGGELVIVRNNLFRDLYMRALAELVRIGSYGIEYFYNNFVYNAESFRSGSRPARGVQFRGQYSKEFYNNTVHDIFGNNVGQTSSNYGFWASSDTTACYMRNNAVTDVRTTGSGAADCFLSTSSINRDYELADDATTQGSNSFDNEDAADEYVSTTPGSVDLHLKAAATSIATGEDKGATNGVEIDIDGRDRDSEGDTWDLGADQYVSASEVATVSPASISWSVIAPTAQFNIEAGVSPLAATWAVKNPKAQIDTTATVSPLTASWSVVDPAGEATLGQTETATVSPLTASWSVIDPPAYESSPDQASVSPVSLSWSVIDPTAEATLEATVAPLTASWTVNDPAAQFNLEAAVSPLGASWSVIDPTAQFNIEALVSPLASSWSVIDPTATFIQPIYTASVTSLLASWTAVEPEGTAVFRRTLIEDLRTYLLNSGVLSADLGIIEQNKSTLPDDLPASRIVIRRRSHRRDLDITGEALLHHTYLDLECIAEDIDTALDLAQTVKELLHGMKGTMGSFCIGGIFVEDHDDTYEPFGLSEDEGAHVAALDAYLIHSDSSTINYTLARPQAADEAPATSIGEDLRTYLISCNLLADSNELGIIEQNKSTIPEDLPTTRICFTRRRNEGDLFIAGSDALTETYFNIECFAEDIEAAVELAHDVKDKLHAHRGQLGGYCIGACFVRNHSDDYRPFNLSEDEGAFLCALDVQFIYSNSDTRAFTLARPKAQTEVERSVCEDLRTYLITHASIIALLPDAADLGVVAQSTTPLPDDPPTTRIVINRRSYQRDTFTGGGDSLANTDVDVEVISEDVDTATDLAEAIKTVLHGYRGSFGNSCGVIFVQDQEDDYSPYALSEDEGSHYATLDLQIIH